MSTLLVTIAVSLVASLGPLGSAMERTISEHATASDRRTQALSADVDGTSIERGAVPSVGSSSQTALRLVGGLWRPLKEAAYQATKRFELVDDLPEPGSPLYRAAQQSFAGQILDRGYGFVDLRLSNAARQRIGPDSLADWFASFSNVSGELQLGVAGFSPRRESAAHLGTYHWHIDGRQYTATLSTRRFGTQVARQPKDLSEAQVRELSILSNRLKTESRQRDNGDLSRVAAKQAEVRRYHQMIGRKEALNPEQQRVANMLDRLAEGSTLAEQGDLTVFVNPGATERFQGILHRRPSELIDEDDRVLWVGRGDVHALGK